MHRIDLRGGWVLEITPVDDLTVECVVLQPVDNGQEGEYHAIFADIRPSAPFVQTHKEWGEMIQKGFEEGNL